MSNQLAKAIALAANIFEGTVDKGGEPYILHCLRVMDGVGKDAERMIIAVLHDCPEDFPEKYPVNFFSEIGLSGRVTNALTLLTHDKSVPYMDYIERLSENEDARIVKIADLKDNINVLRLKKLDEKAIERIVKYYKAYMYLKSKM